MRMITHSYATYDEAVHAVNALEAAGIPHDDISLVSGDKDRTVATTVTGDTTGTGTGATIGTVLGGGAGLLAGIGALAIPGVGPVVAAGWLIATLTGAGVGAAAGGLVGSLANSGVDEADATRYAEHVGRGGTLVTVRASDTDAANAEHILEHGEAGPMGGTRPAIGTGVSGVGMGTGMAGAALMGATTPVAPAPVMPVAARAATMVPMAATADPVAGKREINTPVTEEVRLREERVMDGSRPINRPLTGVAADAFRDRALQTRATSGEAVTTGSVTGAGTPGTVRDNAATRAVDRTLDTNISGENPKV